MTSAALRLTSGGRAVVPWVVRGVAPMGPPLTPSALRDERACPLELGALGVGLLAELHQRRVVRSRLLELARQLGGPRRAVEPPKSVRFLAVRGFERRQRLGRGIQL